MTRRSHLAALCLALLAPACRDRNHDAQNNSTTVPTQVAPMQPQLPPPPMPVASNALADAGVAPMPTAPYAVADAGAPTAPVIAQPTPPAPTPTPTAPTPTPTAPTQPRTTTPGTNNTVNIPSPVQGVPGVQVRRGHGSTTVNVGGIQIAVPTQ